MPLHPFLFKKSFSSFLSKLTRLKIGIPNAILQLSAKRKKKWSPIFLLHFQFCFSFNFSGVLCVDTDLLISLHLLASFYFKLLTSPKCDKVVLCFVAQSCPTLCSSIGYRPPGASVHVIFQARILELIVISYSRGSFQLRDQIQVCCISSIGRQIPYHSTT